MGELPIFTTKAHIFHIDPDTKKKWLPLSTQAVSVSYYHDSARHLYRIISVDGTKVLINSTLTPNMIFTKTSQKFGQWSDAKANTVYGLGFSSEDELLKFMEKFDEMKALSSPHKNDLSSKGNGSTSTPSPRSSALSLQNDSPNGMRQTDDSSTTQQQQLEQFRYENDKLKIALAQSSANAKKWEAELQTLRNNNARLTAALQESASNVDEWNRQLKMYKDENERLRSQVQTAENSPAAESVQRRLTETLDKLHRTEQLLADAQKEAREHRQAAEDLKTMESRHKQLLSTVESVQVENRRLHQDNDILRQQLKDAVDRANQLAGDDRLRGIQQQLTAKINELYVVNDSLADLVPHTQ